MSSVPRRRWPEQWASRDATLVAHGISESLPCTVLVTHRRHELDMVWVWRFGAQALCSALCPLFHQGRDPRGQGRGPWWGLHGECRRVRAGAATLSPGRAKAARERMCLASREGQGEGGDHHPVEGEDRWPGQRGLGRGQVRAQNSQNSLEGQWCLDLDPASSGSIATQGGKAGPRAALASPLPV